MAYSNSKLVTYTQISPNRTSPRNHAIDRVSVHCVVGQMSVESMGGWFVQTASQSSCNYGIGTDGRIALIVEEKDRSWCTSSRDNDNRAVTIECASDKTHPYAVNAKVYAALLDLLTDICRRNGKKKLLWFGDKDKTLAYAPKPDEMVMTVHRWFANKSCPGQYLYDRHGQIAAEVTARLTTSSSGTQINKNMPIGDSTVDEISRVVYNEAGVIGTQDALVAVAQCIKDMTDNGGYGKGITDVMKRNFAAYGKADTTDAARQAVYDVFVNGRRRFNDAVILQFRSFTKYSDGKGNMDKKKCAALLDKYEYLGKDMRNNEWGHLYFGHKIRIGGTSGTQYIVQAGSYSKKANAKAQADRMKAAGLPAIIKKDGDQYKIQCGVFSEKVNAETLKDRLIKAGFDAVVKQQAG